MSTLRLVQTGLQTGVHNQLVPASQAKGRRRLAQARVLGALAGLFGGTLAPLCGGLLTIAGWLATNDGVQHRLSIAGTVLFFLTIPLLMLGGFCMDWMEKGKPRPALKVVAPAEDSNQRNQVSEKKLQEK